MSILIVEDDPQISQHIKETFTAEGYEVDTAFDGFIAEKLLKKNSYECVVLDINLPHKNGYDICLSFRQYNTTTPVLLLTAFDELEDKIQGFDNGADDYLTKPFYMQELLMRVRSLIKRNYTVATEEAEQVLTIHDITINRRLKKVTRNNIPILLTPREYQILLKLVLANGEMVSKQDLVKEIWGVSFSANTNTIEVYINFLRNKIDKPFDRPLIKTRVGYGYYIDLHQ